MTLFRLFLTAFLLILLVYTGKVILGHGANLIPLFFSEMSALTWQGQFNLDFMGFLLLSAIWTAWRNEFSPVGLALALIAGVGGMLFLTIYLLYLIAKTKGDIRVILLGENRA